MTNGRGMIVSMAEGWEDQAGQYLHIHNLHKIIGERICERQCQ